MKNFEFINGYHKTVIENNMVHLFELMGDRWVELGPAECWSDELIMEEFGEYLDSSEPHNHKFEVEIVNERTHRLVAHEVFEAEREVYNEFRSTEEEFQGPRCHVHRFWQHQDFRLPGAWK